MTSLSKNARIAGLMYLVGSLVAIVRLVYIPDNLLSDNVTATVNNIATHELLFRFGILTQLLTGVLWIFVTLALYRLFKEVDQGLAVLMVILGSLMVTPIFFVNSVNDAVALLFVRVVNSCRRSTSRSAMHSPCCFLRLHHYGDLANEIFWGLWLLPFGLLVYKSRFLPRVLGAWLMIACFSHLACSFTGFLFPAYEDKVINYTQPVEWAEAAILLWLIIMGAKE